jgi:hypothetical protein
MTDIRHRDIAVGSRVRVRGEVLDQHRFAQLLAGKTGKVIDFPASRVVPDLPYPYCVRFASKWIMTFRADELELATR